MSHRALFAAFAFSALSVFLGCGEPSANTPAQANAKASASGKDAAPKAAEAGAEGDAAHHAHGAPAGDDEGCLHGKEAHDGGSCEHGAAPEPGTVGHFGEAFASTATVSLVDAIKRLDDAAIVGQAVQVKGEINAVCQAKGCWMVIQDTSDPTVQARVLMKDHAFTVPMDGKGKHALVEGTLERKTLSEAQVKHIEKDAGGDPGKVEGERTEVIMTASGVELLPST